MRIDYSRQAQLDLSDTFLWNARNFGSSRASEYVHFLLDRIGALKDDPDLGRLVPGRSDLRRLTVKKRPSGYGHIALYEVQDGAILVVRVLHTAQSWPGLLEDE